MTRQAATYVPPSPYPKPETPTASTSYVHNNDSFERALAVGCVPSLQSLPHAACVVGRNQQGFCLLNNVAIGAAYARNRYSGSSVETARVQRVAIVDFDVHHGNGTEAIVRNVVPQVFEQNMTFPFNVATGKATIVRGGCGRSCRAYTCTHTPCMLNRRPTQRSACARNLPEYH